MEPKTTPVIVLCRHGNTFESHETPYMVGVHEDLPLTAEGETQARRVASALTRVKVIPAKIISAQLDRTVRFADLIGEAFPNVEREIDYRLSELDYGEWSGKTTDELIEAFGSAQVTGWNERGEWPKSGQFLPPEEIVSLELSEVLDEASKVRGCACLVTSSGRIKTLAKLLSFNDLPNHGGKMGTGRVSVLVFDSGKWHVRSWNSLPEELTIESAP